MLRYFLKAVLIYFEVGMNYATTGSFGSVLLGGVGAEPSIWV